MMRVINDRKINYSQQKTNVFVFINNKMNQTLKNERKLRITPTSEVLFEVESATKSWVINLQKHTCNCGLWQISGLPCSHAMPCIIYMRGTYEKFVAPCYSKQAYLRCYSSMIHLLPNKSKWPRIEVEGILPPKIQRPPNKTKTCKRREVDEPPAHKR